MSFYNRLFKKKIRVGGAGSGGSPIPSYLMPPDGTFSKIGFQIYEALDLICEGPILGLTDQNSKVLYGGCGDFLLADVVFTVNASIDPVIGVALDNNLFYEGVIEWGDGNFELLSGTEYTTFFHTYASAGTYQAKIKGPSVPKIRIGAVQGGFGENTNIVSVQSLGRILGLSQFDLFYSCAGITSVNIGPYVDFIGTNTFAFCRSLTNINIPNSITEIGQLSFEGCTSLTSATIGNGVTSIGTGAFLGCSNLATVNLSIPKSVIDVVNDVFSNTAPLLTINVPTGTSGWSNATGITVGGNTNVNVNLV